MNNIMPLFIHYAKKSAVLFCVLVSYFTLIVSAYGSPLFDGTNGNIWVLDENGNIIERRIDVTSPNWIQSFLSNGSPILTLGQGEQAVINQVENSSQLPSPGQPVMSLVGFSAAKAATEGVQNPLLEITPSSGSFDETIKVQIRVPESFTKSGTSELTWSINGTINKLTLNSEGIKTLEPSNGFFVKSLFLVNNGDYTVLASVKEAGSDVIQSSTNFYTLSSTHPDGIRRDTNRNGLPDLVEIAIGLNPLESNWQYDSDNNGWSDFDEWLRSDSLGDDGLPLDTDKDGWSDFDEKLRQTNPNDPEAILPADLSADPLTLTEQNRYRDVPVAGSLYEPEYLLSAKIAGFSSEDTWDSIEVASSTGVTSYDSQSLLTEDEIAKTSVDPSKVPDYKVFSSIAERIKSSKTIALRLPSKKSQIVSSAFSKLEKTEEDEKDKAVAKPYRTNQWLIRQAELTPLYFQKNNTSTQWNTALEWKAAYIQYLRDNLVIQQPIEPNVDTTLDTVLVSAFLSQEAKFQDITDLILVGTSGSTAASRLNITDLESELSKRADDTSYTLDTVYSVLKTAREGNNTVSALFNTLKTAKNANILLPLSKLVAQINTNENNAYQVRLYPIPNALLQIALNQDLLSIELDVDNDGLANQSETMRPISQVTYPWESDYDKDQLADGSDTCPLDPLNECLGASPQPKLVISEASSFSEPSNSNGAQSFAIISFTLDKKYDEAVTVQYQSADENDGAVEGVDYTKVAGTLTIPAGEQVGFILIPILPDEQEEDDERFLLNITQVTGAAYNTSEPIVVVIKDTQLDPNAPVVNDIPQYIVASGESLMIENTDLLAKSNASDPNNETLTIGAIVSEPTKGSLTKNADGFVYNSVNNIDKPIASGKADFVTKVSGDHIIYREVDGGIMRFKTYQISTGQTETIHEATNSTAEFKGFFTRDDWDGAYFAIPRSSISSQIASWAPESGLRLSILFYNVDKMVIDPTTSRAYSCMDNGFRSRWYQFYINQDKNIIRSLISTFSCDAKSVAHNFRLNNKFCLSEGRSIYCIQDIAEGVAPLSNSLVKENGFLFGSQITDITSANTSANITSVFVDANEEDYRPDVVISGNWLAVSDGSYDHYRGIVKLYQLNNGSWELHQSISPPSSDYFKENYGSGIAMSGDHLMLLSSKNEIHSYRMNTSKPSNQWEFEQTLSIPLPDSYKDLPSIFSPSLALSPDGLTLAVGRRHFSREDYVYVYKKDISSNKWVLEQTINEQSDAYSFGFELAVSDNFLLVGDPGFRDGQRTGRVWAYRDQDGSYSLDYTFTVPDLPGPPRRFGSSLAISESEDVIVIGTPSTGSYGTAYVYERADTNWSSHIELRRGNGGNGYGADVEISDGYIYVSSYASEGVVDAYQKENGSYKLKARFMGDDTKKGLGTNIASDNGYLVATYSSTKDGAFNIYKALPDSVELSQSVALLTPPVSRFSIFNLQEDEQGTLQAFKLADVPAESATDLSVLALSDGTALFSAYSEASHKLFKWGGINTAGLAQIDIPQPNSVSDSAKVVGTFDEAQSFTYLLNQYSDTQKQVIKIAPSNGTAESALIFNSSVSIPSSLAQLNGDTYFLKGDGAGCHIHSLMSPDLAALSNIECLSLIPLQDGWMLKQDNSYRYTSQEKVTGKVEFTVEVNNESLLTTPMKVEIDVQ